MRVDTIIVVTTAFAQGLGMNVAVEDMNVAAAADMDTVARARADRGIFNGDFAGVDDLNAISGVRNDSQVLVSLVTLIFDDERSLGRD